MIQNKNFHEESALWRVRAEMWDSPWRLLGSVARNLDYTWELLEESLKNSNDARAPNPEQLNQNL